jgi:hypothetical protein
MSVPINLQVALQWAGAGAAILPVEFVYRETGKVDKKPRIQWRDRSTADPETIKKWWAQWPDSVPGIDLAKTGFVVLDGDRHGGPDGVEGLERLFKEHRLDTSAIPMVVTQSQGRHAWFRQPVEGEPLGNRDKAVRDSGINIRGHGGFIVAPGARLPNGREYKRDPNTPCALEAVQTGNVPVLPPSIEKLLRANGHSATPCATRTPSSPREESYALAALDNIAHKIASTPPNTGRNIELNNGALAMGHMVAAGWIGRATVVGRLLDAAAICGLVRDDGQGSVLATIKSGLDAGEKEPHPPLRDRDAVYKDDSSESGLETSAAAETSSELCERDLGEDLEMPPPREWLLGTNFCRTFLSSLVAAGGVGKTAVRYAQFLALAAGRDDITNEHVHRRSRVLVVSLEDDTNELKRRMFAAMKHHKVSRDDIKGYLFVSAPGRSAGKLLEVDPKTRATRLGRLVHNLEASINRCKPDVVSIDPFIKSHSAEENTNAIIDEVCQVLTDLAAKHNIAVDAPHHVSKGPADPGNADKARGASAMVDAARLVKTLTPMSSDEARAFGISQDDRKQYIRVDGGKTNIARGNATQWFELVSVALDNGNARYPNGDNIQVAAPWKPPSLWADLSDALLNRILDKIDGGLPGGERYSDAAAAKGRAAWQIVLDLAPQKTEHQAKEIVRQWLKNGVLEKREYHSESERKERQGLFVNDARRPGSAHD